MINILSLLPSTTENDAISFIKTNKTQLIKHFADPEIYPPHDNPFTIFMAGAPGAGKTEFSKAFITHLIEQGEDPIVRIDIDEVRDFMPNTIYNGKNSSEVQKGAAIGVEKIFDSIQQHKQNAIVDSTLANYDKAKSDIIRAKSRNRKIGILYIYQDPLLAWDFTHKREFLEGRHVPKEVFISSFINSQNNAQQLKNEFPELELHLVIKSLDNTIKKSYFNISHLDGYLKVKYTIGQLQKIIN